MLSASKANRELEQILNLDANVIGGDEVLVEIGWDSMAAVMFVAMADEKFSQVIDAESLAAAKSVADLHRLLGVVS
jgi:acyl carrier protein